MRILLLFALLQVESVWYGKPLPYPDGQSWPRIASGCTVNRETGVITCGTAPPAKPVTDLKGVVQ
jgi:hypothetical protein